MLEAEHARWKALEEDHVSLKRKRSLHTKRSALAKRLWDETDPDVPWEMLTPQWHGYLTNTLSAYIELDLAPDQAWEESAPARLPRGAFLRCLTRMLMSYDDEVEEGRLAL